MNRQTKILAALFLSVLMLATSAFAQLELKLKSDSGFTISGLTERRVVGDAWVVGKDSKPVLTPFAIATVTITTEAANTEIEIEDQARNNLDVDEFEKSPNELTFTKPGKYWVTVTAIDFPKNIYSKKKLTVDLAAPPAPPTPGPGPIDPSETFDNLTERVAIATAQFDPVDRAKYHAAYSSVAAKMRAYEIKTLQQAGAWLASQGLTCRNLDACRQFSTLITSDGTNRRLSFDQAAQWYQCIAEGLK